MNILFIIIIILYAFTIYMIFREIGKRKKLGNILMKVKLDIRSYLPTFIQFTIGLFGAYLFTKQIVEIKFISEISEYNKTLYEVVSFLSVAYLITPILIVLRMIKSREIREKGITTLEGIINFHDIIKINWLSKNRIEFIFVSGIYQKQRKKKWSLKSNQITELKKYLQEKYYDYYNISVVNK